ncbi:MAG: TetR/AcrR family transcriptional regulator [Actinomycetota bacterium]
MADTAPRRMRREDRRTSLLDAAAEVLRRPERSVLSFEAVAEAAGVSPTLPYKYFGSVDEIAEELYRHLVGEVDRETDVILADGNRDFEDKVRAGLTLWTDVLRRDGLLLLRLTDDVAHPSLRAAVDERRRRAVDVWADELTREFDLAPTTARVVAGSLTAGSTAALRSWITDRLDRTEVIDLFVVMLRAQIAAAADAAPPSVSRRSTN